MGDERCCPRYSGTSDAEIRMRRPYKEKTLISRRITAFLILSSIALIVEARTHRSTAVKHAFQREHPCPSTGKRRGACPGYVKDHIKPLCAGGPDAVSNMQWQTVKDGKAKDRLERRECGR